MIHKCLSEEEYAQLLASSYDKPVLLMKHSTSCPISRGAHEAYQHFAETCETADCWVVHVIEQRSLSQQIAAKTGIRHESPQALLFRNGKVAWQATHYDITKRALEEAVRKCEMKDEG